MGRILEWYGAYVTGGKLSIMGEKLFLKMVEEEVLNKEKIGAMITESTSALSCL